MAVWFKPEAGADLDLIPASMWTHDDLRRVVQEVEDEIISHYTAAGAVRLRDSDGFTLAELYYYVENNVEYTVQLMGYHADPASASGYNADRTQWTGFCKAFRQTIANVVVHRLKRMTDAPEVASERRGERSWTYRESWTEKNRDERWPRYWNRLLMKYARKPPVWSV